MISSITGIPVISYLRIFKRIRNIKASLNPVSEHYDGAIDSTGFNITICGDYLATKWHRKRREWQKLHVIVSINDISVLAFAISDEHGNDSPHGKRILKRVVKNLRYLWMTRYMTAGIYKTFLMRMLLKQ
jgi:hypothetical protein